MLRACAALLVETNSLPPPVRLAPIARHLGAKLKYDDSLRIGREEAAIRLIDERLILWVSRSSFEDPFLRQRCRFSIAHEIGHLILFKLLGPEFLEHTEVDKSAFKLTENLCDLAASFILVPRDYLSEAIRARSLRSNAVRSLAEAFDVSHSVIMRAIADLTPKSSIVEWRRYQRHGGEQLTWRVWKTHLSSQSTKLTSWLPRGCTTKHVSGLGNLSDLFWDQPEARHGLSLTLKAQKEYRDGIVCRWPQTSRTSQMPLANDGQQEEARPEFHIDDSAGRVILLLGERKRLDFSQFGVIE